jgi:hypothetical protein
LAPRFNPAPGWPPPPPGFVPPPHWQPDPSWPPAPPGWQLWVDDGAPDPGSADPPPTWAGGTPAGGFPAAPAGVQARPDGFGTGPADPPPWAGDFGTGTAAAPPWADDLTGPQTAALRGVGPRGQDPFGPQEPFGPRDTFASPRPDGPPGRPGGPGRRAAPAGKANGFAVASLILGVIGITIIGAVTSVVLGILALRQIRQTGQRGRGLAIGGLVCSGLWLALIGAYFVLPGGKSSPAPPPPSAGHSSSSSATSSPTATTPSSSASPKALSASVFSLRPGQCFQNPPASRTILGVTYVTVVPCSTPHNAQAFVQFAAKGTSYPGGEALKHQADTGCQSQIKKTVQTSKIKNTMTLHYLYPLQSSWPSHKTIICIIVNSKANLTTSLLRSHPAH